MTTFCSKNQPQLSALKKMKQPVNYFRSTRERVTVKSRRVSIEPSYFAPHLAKFIAKRCTFSVCFNHILIKCKTNKDYAYLIRNRRYIFCMFATIFYLQEGSDMIRHSLLTTGGLCGLEKPWIIKF